MKLQGKVTKTEVLLLALTGVFLCALAGLAYRDRLAAAQDTPVSVVTERVSQEEAVPPPLDLNTATEAELMELPGIGEVLASRITAYRTAHGPFQSVEELLEVPGIGESKLEALRGSVTVDGKDTE